jgi:hypothetical protein
MARDMDFKDHVDGIMVLRDLGSAGIDLLNKSIIGDLLSSRQLERLLQNIAQDGATLVPGPKIGEVTDLLLSLAMVARTREACTLVSDLGEALERAEQMTSDDEWEALRSSLEQLLSNDALLRVGKAVQLQYEHSNILTDAQVITDVRPVFNREGTVPLAGLVCQTLRIAYVSEGNREQIALALDRADVELLAKECARALRKGDAMLHYLREPRPLPAVVGGADDT